jgi:hypothetical protein
MTEPTVWRELGEETGDLYPGLWVWDDRVTGSITFGRSRLPAWAIVGEFMSNGWDAVEEGWGPSQYGWDAARFADFIHHLLEARGEFGRLLLILADADRRDGELDETDLDHLFHAWWRRPEDRQRVADQLRRCLAALEGGG